MIIQATFAEFGREVGKLYRVPFRVGTNLLLANHALWVRNDEGEPEWEPVAEKKAKNITPEYDRMIRRAPVRK